MSLTPEQKQTVTGWVAAGDNLSAVQKKLAEQFKISMTYRDVRFLVDDLNLELKNPAPKVDTSDVSKTPPPRPAAPPEKKGLIDKLKEKVGMAPGAVQEDDLPPEELPEDDRVQPEMPIAGSLDELVRRATAGELDLVFIALPLRAELRIRAVAGADREVVEGPARHALLQVAQRLGAQRRAGLGRSPDAHLRLFDEVGHERVEIRSAAVRDGRSGRHGHACGPARRSGAGSAPLCRD